MTLEKVISMASRLFFLGAFVLLGLAVIDRIAKAFGYKIILLGRFPADRLLEIAVVLLVFVIAIQLREIKREFKKRNP
ncbi:MAG: hypothetical protein HY298_03800 [Verrucomicrobia bacterium]|nr:hypothetical protein [Verrucomicrobiota bacterium]